MASLTDKITDTRNSGRPVSTTVTSARNPAGTYLECGSTTGWPTVSKVHFVTYKIDSNNKQIANTQQDCVGIVSGNAITQMTVIDGADIGNEIGDIVEMLPTAAWGQDLAEALTEEHDRDGTHGDITTGNITTTGTIDITGSLLLNGISIAAIMYPVGSLYLTTVSTNPASIFGFGTWVAHAKGQALVGKADSGTFVTAGATGGEETVTLTTATMPSHTHSVDPPATATDSQGSHSHTIEGGANWGTSGGYGISEDSTASSNGQMNTDASGAHTHTLNIGAFASASAGTGGAHNNLQPYLVIYVWKRTA
jgi:microcystin-dependent protein